MSFEKRGDIHPDRTRPESEPAPPAADRLEALGADVTARAAQRAAGRSGRQAALSDRLRSPAGGGSGDD